nr:unnamed protein product [Callosobruchus chinensis]
MEASKAQKLKLASSRKRFKELQELKKKKDSGQRSDEGSSEYIGIVETATNSLTSSTHSSINNEHQPENTNSTLNSTQLPNYFGADSPQPMSDFFDSLVPRDTSEHADETPDKSRMIQYFNTPSQQTKSKFEDMVSSIVESPKANDKSDLQYSLFSQNNLHSYIRDTQNIIHPNELGTTDELEDPEIKQNEIFEIHKKGTELNSFCSQGTHTLLNSLQTTSSPPITEGEKNAIQEEISDNSNLAQVEIQCQKIGNLMQLSNQMAEQIDTEYTSSSSITDLEKRNLELTTLLKQERVVVDQQKGLISELQDRLVKSEVVKSTPDDNSNAQMINELAKLREELQCHIQTVSMLVAEKSELATTVSHLELMLKGKTADCEELQARLKTSRSRVADLEREVNMLKSERHHFEHMDSELGKQFDMLKKDKAVLEDQKEEILQDLLEVKEKLKKVSEENVYFSQQNQDLSNKLSLATIKIQQITSGQPLQSDAQVEGLLREKAELERQVAQLNSVLKTLTKERDESNVQYQQYVQQLNVQVSNLNNKIEQLQQENENLSVQEQSRIKHIGELERQLQSLQNERVSFASSSSSNDSNLKSELEKLQETCSRLQVEKTSAEENCTKACNERDMLTKELMAKYDSISHLESEIERLRGNQPDSAKLLATMESDKASVAAARAIKQNSELKEQVEGMKEVLAKLDDDKVQLTEKLDREMSSNKELLDKLQKTELQLQRLTDAIEIKDRELAHLRENSDELSKQVLQHKQLTDRLRHYEAQDSSSHVLQNELQEAKQTIIKLTNEVNTLKSKNMPEITVDSSVESNLAADNEDVSALKEKLIQLEHRNEELELMLRNSNNIHNSNGKDGYTEDIMKTDDICNHNNDVLDKEVAMKYLEDKLKRTMGSIADLTDEKQRLEHLVLQLQGETETIGEYVALYQHQRMMLKQRAVEKDHQLKQLATDREQMKIKLEKLNELIRKLVEGKGAISKEILMQHGSLTSEDCYIEPATHNDSAGKVDSVNTDNSQTANEIIELISEIKSSNLVEPCDSINCSWCSGQLITV